MKLQKLTFKSKFIAFFEIIRPINCFMIGLATLIGIQISNPIWYNVNVNYLFGTINGLLYGFIAFTVAFFAASFSMTLNDYVDYFVDLINSPEKPIPSGRITREHALKYSIILAVISAFLSLLLLNILSLLLVISGLLISFIYNMKLKKRGFIGNVAVAYSTALPFIFGASLFSFSNFAPIFILVILALISNIGREIIKGIIDITGDRTMGIITVANKYGIDFATKLASFMIFIAILLSILPFPLKLLQFTYSLPVIITDAILIYATLIVVKNKSRESAIRAKNLYLVGMLITLIGFFIISYYG
jgi:4-hydroxybenzoate polyprenyltransferase and related prenyltransferases